MMHSYFNFSSAQNFYSQSLSDRSNEVLYDSIFEPETPKLKAESKSFCKTDYVNLHFVEKKISNLCTLDEDNEENVKYTEPEEYSSWKVAFGKSFRIDFETRHPVYGFLKGSSRVYRPCIDWSDR